MCLVSKAKVGSDGIQIPLPGMWPRPRLVRLPRPAASSPLPPPRPTPAQLCRCSEPLRPLHPPGPRGSGSGMLLEAVGPGWAPGTAACETDDPVPRGLVTQATRP